MRTPGRFGSWLAVAAMAAVGCRAHVPVSASASSYSPPAPSDLPVTQPGSLEPQYKTLPSADPANETVAPSAPPGTTHRGLTEDVCRTLAAAHAPAAGLIERENEVPPHVPATRREARRSSAVPCDEALRELRGYAIADARNTAATDALEQFFRLADAEGRAELLRATVPILDELRATVRKGRAEGLRVPADPDDLDRQRAQVLALIGQADLGTAQLNIDLKRRVGLPGNGSDRLWPTGSFPVSADPVNAETAVAVALERRPDLQLLRAAYLKLTPESLPVIRELLRGYEPKGATIGRHSPETVPAGHSHRAKELEAAAQAEVAVRREQLFELTSARERQAADEVRAAAATLNAQTRQVALARWRAEQLAAKVGDAKKQGPLVELPAHVEAVRARAEVVAAVFAWHQARVKLLGAQGLLVP